MASNLSELTSLLEFDKIISLLQEYSISPMAKEAFESLDLEKCTEEECIRKIQEILQVERLFILQILREADFTQLTLNLVKADSKRVAEGVCQDCSISELYDRIDELAEK
ncbi:hypothetical protein IH922_01800, partial [candidate division KSB1 bacterium]|nr:hypothetical protein [candidate division KSB1 bacterium]